MQYFRPQETGIGPQPARAACTFHRLAPMQSAACRLPFASILSQLDMGHRI